ncbi:het domain-containing protein [Neofusicoccum parvum]|nr:het domain-containing protein [Neofusicoccum parvum]
MGALCRQEEMPDVDYNAAEDQVYREMAVKLLTKGHPTCPLPSSCAWNALGVLALVNSDPDTVRRPSWIPDWTLPLTYNDLWWDYADHNSGKMAAGGGRTQSLRFSAEVPRGLVLRGKVCARVASTGEGSVLTGVFGHGYVEEGRPDEEWWPLSRGFGESRKARSLDEWILRAGEYLRGRLEDGPLREGRVARTLCANIDFGETSRHVAKGARDGFSTFANAWEAYKIYTQYIFEEDSIAQEAADLSQYEPRFKDFRAGAGLACRGRRLFATDDGHVGIGPGRIKEGDVISIIYGAGWPFVLRPHGNNFLLVGYCYVDEIMNGEMVDNVDIPERDICLV